MKILKSTFIVALYLISINILAQQGAPEMDVDELKKEKEVVYENYPGIFKKEEINKIEKIDPKRSKIYYTRGKVNFEAVVNSDRKELLLLANCEQISPERLPGIVQGAFHRSDYCKLKIQKAFIVANPYLSNYYRIDIYQKDNNGVYYKSLFYTDMGLYMDPPY